MLKQAIIPLKFSKTKCLKSLEEGKKADTLLGLLTVSTAKLLPLITEIPTHS